MSKTHITSTPFQPSAANGVTEYHTLFHIADAALPFAEQLEALIAAYTAWLGSHQDQTPLFRRFFLSDAANQQPALEQALDGVAFCATSIVQQPPLDGTKIALWLWSASDMEPQQGCFTHNGLTHYWMGGSIPYSRADISSLDAHPRLSDSEHQMRDLFDAWRCELKPMDMTIADNGIRTWIFVRDVDVNYHGVVEGRRKYFARIGLTPKTHFLASTGIEGRHALPEVLVQMDGYAVRGLQPGQVQYLYAKDHLNPTYEYGVTFERGTAVTYGDRRHVFISGTASIDDKGRVVHEGDIRLQTLRMLENIRALLAEADCTMADIAMAIVYLRDTADAALVRSVLADELPQLNYVLVLAPVCRPKWLVEMECIAVRAVSRTEIPNF